MISVEDLLKPISAEEPCGPDLAYDPAFQQLETLARGKPETQFSAAEDPNWKDLRELSIEFHGKSKHLTAGVILALCLLKTEGFAGFRDGLAVVRGLLENYWDTAYPKLDPDDNNDPTERMNILSNLASSGEPYQLIPRLQDTALALSPSIGPVKLKDIILAKQPAGTPVEGQPLPLTESQIQAIFKDSNQDTLKATYEAVGQSIDTVKLVDAFLTEKVGTRGTNLEDLINNLKQAQAAMAPFVAGAPVEGGVEAGGEAADGVGETSSGGGANVSVPGSIRSRDDVVRTLDRICDFYNRTEPSSPVPLILYRARRMVMMNFMELINELTPDSVTTVRVVTGPQPGETTTE